MVYEADSLSASVSAISGAEADPLTCTKPRLPTLISPRASGVKLGARVVTLIAPAVVFLPYSVPCGPRRISTRSTSVKSNVAAAMRLL